MSDVAKLITVLAFGVMMATFFLALICKDRQGREFAVLSDTSVIAGAVMIALIAALGTGLI